MLLNDYIVASVTVCLLNDYIVASVTVCLLNDYIVASVTVFIISACTYSTVCMVSNRAEPVIKPDQNTLSYIRICMGMT